MNKVFLIFYRRITGQELSEIPPHAVAILAAMGEDEIRRILVATDLQTASISQVAIRYSIPRAAVRAIGRRKGLVK